MKTPNKKNTIIKTLAGIAAVSGAIGVGYLLKNKKPKNHKVTKIYDQVLDLGTYTELNEKAAEQAIAAKYNHWGGCSAIAKTTKSGETLVGRTMDLDISDKPAYVFRTRTKGKYQTIGLLYSPFGGPSEKEALASGVPDEIYQTIPFLASDTMNEHGLYIEENMRTDEYFKDGASKFGTPSTNPKSKERIAVTMLPTYLALRAKTVAEAVKIAKSIDIYGLKSEKLSWGFAFLMVDATGDYGLLEIVNNEVIWHEKQAAQTNFYIATKYAKIEDVKYGIGRYDALMQGIKAVENEKDMYDLINKVTYSGIYDIENAKFDVRSDHIGSQDGWSCDYVMDDKNRSAVEAQIKINGDRVRHLTREQKIKTGGIWESAFTIVANTTKKTLYVRFFEDETRSLNLDFDSN